MSFKRRTSLRSAPLLYSLRRQILWFYNTKRAVSTILFVNSTAPTEHNIVRLRRLPQAASDIALQLYSGFVRVLFAF